MNRRVRIIPLPPSFYLLIDAIHQSFRTIERDHGFTSERSEFITGSVQDPGLLDHTTVSLRINPIPHHAATLNDDRVTA
jgi:hypothetical protein